MRLTAMTLSRYRSFKDRQRIELAPLTIIIGKNGSGKSVLSRLPVLLAGSISEHAEGPLDLTAGDIEHGVSFQDLANSRSALPFALGIEVSDDEGNEVFEFEATLRYVHETRSLFVEEFVCLKNRNIIFQAKIVGEEQIVSASPLYEIEIPEENRTVQEQIRFTGLIPDLYDIDIKSQSIYDALMSFEEALLAPSYLGPFRAEPQNFMRSPKQGIRALGPKGEFALEMLADDRLRREGILAKEVERWFSDNLGSGVVVDITGEQPQIRVVDAGSGFPVLLSDTGAGFPQSLPIVVQHFAYRLGRISSPILVVEQPELHLHPAAHGALADLLIDSAIGSEDWASATCIAETHSEQFIMRVRRRVAEGKLNPAQVTILSLNHVERGAEEDPPIKVKVISLDDRGNPDSWPSGVFEEALTDLAAMRKNSREREA